MKRELRPIGPEKIEDYLTIYLNAYPAFKSIGEMTLKGFYVAIFCKRDYNHL